VSRLDDAMLRQFGVEMKPKEHTIQKRLRRIERHSGYLHLGAEAADLIDDLATALEDMLGLLESGRDGLNRDERINWANERLKEAKS
jgi:hypothetical protein